MPPRARAMSGSRYGSGAPAERVGAHGYQTGNITELQAAGLANQAT
ncbi:hypothetical protein J2853_009700 [Streptosporangium lutulentum]|uniref:Uncharacterized protein n=1 Tax=Streptosporangium lutulentum TaxID=1461250 RepID=A0ABT9QWS4_9ACTN|nr:hypothetical protein [Streptosporangium lutulentum]